MATLVENKRQWPNHRRRGLPGFGLSMGFTLLYLTLIVLIPLSGLVIETKHLSWHAFHDVVTDPEAVAAYKLSFGASLFAAIVNAFFGFLVAWVLVRYPFPGRKLVNALVDLPFALPTAVAGISLASIYAADGWIGHFFTPHNIKIAYAAPGIYIALVFVGLPYVVRTVEPVLQEMESELEEAASSLGANRLQTFLRVIFPTVFPAVITGFTLAFARAIGEYGSVVFISSDIPFQTEIVPQLIINKLQEFDYPSATALGLVMLIASFLLLLLINLFQKWTTRYLAE